MKCICTVFAILLIFISVMAPTAANEADWLPDANLRTAVRSALSIADDAALTQQGMQDLTAFTARNSQISNITGLEHATALTSLDIRDNTVTDVSPLSALTHLEALRLKGNTLSDISPLSGLTTLTLLNLRLTGISSVSALSGLTNLAHLRVDDNSLTDVEPLTSLTNLRKLWIAGNALTNAHLLSSLTNLTTLDIEIPDPPDTTAPDVSISVPSEVQNGAFGVIITFTEFVSGFEQEDLSLGGTATASITAWNATDNTVFTAEITPTTSGTVTLDIAADVATDAANNPNTAATQQMVTVELKDETAPTVSISVPSGTQNGAFDVTITFTEVVSGFEQADLSISGTATASVTAWNTTDDTVFTATITPTMNGNVILNIPVDVATDAAGNKNTAATPQKVVVELKDETAPTVSISVPSGTQNGAFDVTITFTEVVSDFVQADLLVSGTAPADITAWNTVDNTVYTATITPTTSGTVILDVAADVANDAGGNQNTAATQQTVDVSIAAPVSIPNAALENLVRTALNLAVDATITTADMPRLTSLGGGAAKRLGINDLTGLEYATNLTSLTLPRNSISNLSPLSNLSNLTTLALSRNNVSDISPLSGLTSLRTLHLKQNSISNLSPLSGLTNLTSLVLKNNSITDISDLEDLVADDGTTSLTTLQLEHNNISSTDANRQALTTLKAAGVSVDITLANAANAPANTDTGTLPHQTQLLANYPNPFNPETWIPYQLAVDSDVQILIYDISGTLVRRLELGYQPVGYYTGRSRAAHWDGRNTLGESVANGVYFYQLHTNEVSSLRKMVILK